LAVSAIAGSVLTVPMLLGPTSARRLARCAQVVLHRGAGGTGIGEAAGQDQAT
jgi:hypothetical protein